MLLLILFQSYSCDKFHSSKKIREKFYDGLTFHRREEGFVIQGGDPAGNGTGGPGYKFGDELVTKDYMRGIVAMANSGPNTNGSQFFIMLDDTPSLPKQYTIFGKVINGLEAVDAIQVGDKIVKLARKCKGCDSLMDQYMGDIQYEGFCSTSCETKNQWKNASEDEKKTLVENAHRRTRERVQEGIHQFTDPKVRSRGTKELGRRAYGKTWLEERFGWMLNELGIQSKSQHPVDKYFVDFAIPDRMIAIEVDGEYWHRDKIREEKRQSVIESYGWQVLRFSESQINENLFGCGEEIQRVLDNHEGKYEFFSEEILWIEEKIHKKNMPLINLGVEEDNSYIAKGFVVHNCGNFSVLQKDLSKRSEENDIGEFVDHIAEVKPKFFLMDNLYKSLAIYPHSFYAEKLPEYDIFFEPVSNYHYGNTQKNRKRLFTIGALKKLEFVFKAGEQPWHGKTSRDVFGDLPYYEDIPEIQHTHVDPNEPAMGWNIPGRSSKDNDGKATYYTYGELAERFKKTAPGKCLTYLSQRTGTEKHRLGYVKFGWDQHSYVLHGGSSSRYHTHFHPETGLPLTVRERARVQGFPDSFIFVLPEKDKGNLGVKQTGKAMPVEFCRFAAKQFIAHLEEQNFDEASGSRFSIIPEEISREKEEYCKNFGYSYQEQACNTCWKKRNCLTRTEKITQNLIQF